MVAVISSMFNFSFYIFQLCNISLSPRVRFSAVFFSVLQLFESLVVYKAKKNKKWKNSKKSYAAEYVLPNIAFCNKQPVKREMKEKNLCILNFATLFWQQMYPFITTSGR